MMSYEWTAERISHGILTWLTWPGFQGVQCDKCRCDMNVLGGSYGHRCVDCDPKGKHYCMHDFHNWGFFAHKKPKWGPSRSTIHRGYDKAMEISESQRLFKIGDIVLTCRDSCRINRGPTERGREVKLEKSSYPGMRYYRVDLSPGKEFEYYYEKDLSPLRKFQNGERVFIRHRGGWILTRIIRLENNEESHFLYRCHWYQVKLLVKSPPGPCNETKITTYSPDITTSMVHSSVFDGMVREVDIKHLNDLNPGEFLRSHTLPIA